MSKQADGVKGKFRGQRHEHADPDRGRLLDAIVTATARATTEILGAAERLQEIGAKLREGSYGQRG